MRSIHAICAALLACSTGLAQHSISSTFTTNNSITTTSVLPAVGCDITVTNPAGVVINQFDVNCPYVDIAATLEFYTTDLNGTHVGTMVGPPPGTWMLRAKASIVTQGAGTAAPAILDKPVHLPAGTYGMLLVYRYCSSRYVGSAANPPTQLVYGNGDITLTMGAIQNEAFVSAPFSPRVPSFTIYYDYPLDVVDFTADVTSGSGPLTVNFTDRSAVTSGTVLGYNWDFEDDGIFDAFTQNATFTYPSCGDYSVRLRLLTSNGPIERVWTDMIAVDPLVADFTASPFSGAPLLTVQFGDMSSPTATSWAWDFDGDGIVDSTVQSPSMIFAAGSYPVSLTVSNGCRTATKVRRINAVTDTFSTNFTAANNLIAKQALAFFDLTITSSDAIALTSLDVNTVLHVGNPVNIKVWLTDGSANGKQQLPAAWREVANGSGVSAASNNPTEIILDRPILMLPGHTYGLAVNYLDAQAYYNSPGSTTMSHPDFTVDFWGVNTATTPFSNAPTVRQFNGTLYYLKSSQFPVGAISHAGLGCPGSLGVPTLTPIGTTRPQLGTSLSVELGNLPLNFGVLFLGFSDSFGPFGPLPVDLTQFGMPGCFDRVATNSKVIAIGAGNTAQVVLPLPNSTALAGVVLFMQALVVDPGTNAFGAVMSDSSAAMLGIY